MTREDVIKRIKRILEECKEHNEDDEIAVCYVTPFDADALHMAIKALEQEPKECHNENKDYDDCDQFVCSNCGIELQDWHAVERSEDGDISYHEYEFRYCPNCGAKIRKGNME